MITLEITLTAAQLNTVFDALDQFIETTDDETKAQDARNVCEWLSTYLIATL